MRVFAIVFVIGALLHATLWVAIPGYRYGLGAPIPDAVIRLSAVGQRQTQVDDLPYIRARAILLLGFAAALSLALVAAGISKFKRQL